MDEHLNKNEQMQEAITVNDKVTAREKTDHADVPSWWELNQREREGLHVSVVPMTEEINEYMAAFNLCLCINRGKRLYEFND